MKKKGLSYTKYCMLIAFLLIALNWLNAQTTQRVVNNQTQSWISINSTERFTNKWGIVADLHYRANQIFASPNFYFARCGVNYWLKDNITFTLGYAHMWLAPTTAGWHTFSNENRIYAQAQIISTIGKVTILNRIRNELRWQEKIAADTSTHTNKFTDRIRYLASFTIPVVKNPIYPALVISDELSVQTGKEVVYNVFDQNRLFLGIKQSINKRLSFDLGYMLVDQEKADGYHYDQNHTFRCFFYYMPDLRKHS
jgi:biotin transporter BioY